MTSDVEIGDPRGDKSMRQRTQSFHVQSVEPRPFAGRVGGNVQFVVHPTDELAKKVPDAAPNFPWKGRVNLNLSLFLGR